MCENCVTRLCTVVISTASAMGVEPVSINKYSYLQMVMRSPKAGVTGSNPVGRAIKTMSYGLQIKVPVGISAW